MTTTPSLPRIAEGPAERGPLRAGGGAPLPLSVAAGAAVVAGLALVAAFPEFDAWWAAPLGVALLAVVTHRRSAWTGAGLGLLAGLAFFAPLLHWTAIDPRIGWWPWLLLALLQASFIAALGAAAAACSRVVDRWGWSWPLVTAALWTADEALRSRLPFGGFPWGRLAFSQAESPLLALAALGGAPLVSFGVALVGGLVAAAAWRLCGMSVRDRDSTTSSGPGRGWVAGLTVLGVAFLVVLSGLAVPQTPARGAPVTVALVQGNVPRLGLSFNAQRRAVLDNHVDATMELAARVARGDAERPDLVIWPENASDIDPTANLDAAQQIDQAALAIGVPILVGTLTEGPDGTRNTGLVWHPGTGAGDRYVKQHPVPFAEYLPMRPLVRAVTAKADMVGNFVAGDRPGVLRVGPAVLGDVICFEVAYDNLVRNTVTGGAQLLVVQTNNATFNAAEARQQMAMVRLRAVEHGRPAVMASTVGVSGFAGTDGEVHDASRFFTRFVAVRGLRLGEGRTLATRLGALPELALSLGALMALALGVALSRTGRGSGSGRAGRRQWRTSWLTAPSPWAR